jgi:hypothetical protein
MRRGKQPVRIIIIVFFDPQQSSLCQVDQRDRDVSHNHPAHNHQCDFSGLQSLKFRRNQHFAT